MSNRSINLTPELYEYLLSVSSRESKVLRELREETATLEMARMQISPEQGQFLAMLVRLLGARRAIEVGVFTGYSSLCVASALPENGDLIACDVSEEWTAVARRYWQRAGLATRIDLRLRPALDTLRDLVRAGEGGSFDFAFIDADKTSYADYYEQCLLLMRVGGLIVIDNVLWDGRVIEANVNDADTIAIRALNKALLHDKRIELSMIPVGDGLTLARKL